MDYHEFLRRKAIYDPPTGMDHGKLPSMLKPFQHDIVSWALRRGRAAIFAGTGLGKSFMELSWAQEVSRHTRKPVLMFTPLAVGPQMVREASKFGIDAKLAQSQSEVLDGIYVTNYQKMPHFNLAMFGGVVLDESSILKNETGHYRNELIRACHNVPFRLAATATPAPNDFMELGNHAEFLGVMSYTDMLASFFTHDGGETQKWRLKKWAEAKFWQWMASWSVMLRHPRDLGYNDAGYDLPELIQIQHMTSVEYAPNLDTGLLFPLEAQSMSERIAARKTTITDRVGMAVDITPRDRPFVWWCNLNTESEALTKAIPGAVEVRGYDKDDDKARKLNEFSEGKIRVLVTKPSIAGFGMNWQHCSDTGFVGLNDSFEQVYQAVRRFWRFGQKKPVTVNFIASEIEGAVVANIKRKEMDADKMAASMVEHMADLSSMAIKGQLRDTRVYNPNVAMSIPSWIGG